MQQIKTEDDFSVILADVRKTCYSSWSVHWLCVPSAGDGEFCWQRQPVLIRRFIVLKSSASLRSEFFRESFFRRGYRLIYKTNGLF
jgi:hypothetical protein